MILNETNKNKVRKHILNELEKVPNGIKIKLEKEILEDLIFHKYYDKFHNLLKIPVWSGDFLSKLDLSELSFDNTILTISCGFENVLDYDRIINKFLNDFHYPDSYMVKPNAYNFRNSNANIKFENIYIKTSNEVTNAFTGIFSNMDLSNSQMEKPSNLFYSCDFSNSILPIKQINWKNLVSLNKINKSTKPRFIYCNFTNTGLKINFKSNLFEQINPRFLNHYVNTLLKQQNNPNNASIAQHIVDLTVRFSSDYKELEQLGIFFLGVKQHYYDGCYINNYPVINGEIHETNELDKFLKEISNSITKQLNNMSK